MEISKKLASLKPIDFFASKDTAYRTVPAVDKLLSFFESKGLKALKEEDRREEWYQDWIDYNAKHGIYSSLLSPKAYSSKGTYFNLLTLVRFSEAFGSCSPSHGYSFQVTFLGLFPILMSTNEELKREAIKAFEQGALFAFGVSEQHHGSDLYSNEFEIKESGKKSFTASGKKYYIGNANCASIISVLGRTPDGAGNTKKDAFMFFALRQKDVSEVKKIPTLGVRAAFVGAFEVKNCKFTESDVISRGNKAWDSVFGTVNLGKFLLGFGSVGICQRAFAEAIRHTRNRVLFGKTVFDMPHIRSALVQAYARLCGMKLYAYRAADYLQMASAKDRRYLLFNSVQKARVSTEGVKVMELLAECVGARGFECETYFENSLRDSMLIPGLEGSTHINYGITAKLIKNYFFQKNAVLPEAPSMALSDEPPSENLELMKSRAGDFKSVGFNDFKKAFHGLDSVANVKIFFGQAKAFRDFSAALFLYPKLKKDADFIMALGKIFSMVAYGQLIAENAKLTQAQDSLLSLIFHQLIEDFSIQALKARSLPQLPKPLWLLLGRCIQLPNTPAEAQEKDVDILLRSFS